MERILNTNPNHDERGRFASTPSQATTEEIVKSSGHKEYIEGLYDQDRDDLHFYTGTGYEFLNKGMRDGTHGSNKFLVNLAKSLQYTIDEAPPLKAPIAVHRGLILNDGKTKDKVLQGFKDAIGKDPIQLPSFTSTSIDPNVADRFSHPYKNTGVTIRITANKGLYLGNSVSINHEDSFLMAPTAKFKVTKVDGSTVHMEQV